MAAGIPVVATEAGGNKELVDDGYTGFLIPPNDHIKLANKILLLLQNKELAEKMGKNGKKKVYEKYSWDKIIKEYEKYYYEIVKGYR